MRRRMTLRVTGLLVLCLLAGSAFLGASTAGPPKPPKPEPLPVITPGQILWGVDQLLPVVKQTPKNRIPSASAARYLDDGSYLLSAYKADRPAMLAVPREVRLFAAVDDGQRIGSTLLGRRAGMAPLGAMVLERDYKLGFVFPIPPEPDYPPVEKGRYGIVAIWDPENKLDAETDPKNETDLYLLLVGEDRDGDGLMEFVGFVGLLRRELARVMATHELPVEFGQLVLLNLVAALLQ